MTSNEKSNWLIRLINKIIEQFFRKNRQVSSVIEEQKDLKTKSIISKSKQEVALQEEREVPKNEKPNLDLSPNDTASPFVSGKQKVPREVEMQFRSQPHISSKEFRIPILQALVNLGGSAKRKLVFEELEKIMEDQLTENDWNPLPSKPGIKRWQKIATGTRTYLLKGGYISVDPQKGVWSISEKGRHSLKNLQAKRAEAKK